MATPETKNQARQSDAPHRRRRIIFFEAESVDFTKRAYVEIIVQGEMANLVSKTLRVLHR